MLIRLGAIAASITVMAAAGGSAPAQEPLTIPTRAAVADDLKKALERSREATGPAEQVEILRNAADVASAGRPENFLLAEAFRSPLDPPEADAGKLAERWRTAIAEAVEILEFEVQEESPLPEGFPKPLPLGEIGIQEYPAYRMATAEVGFGDNGAFMQLFGHIKAKGISMTAPVEMNYAEGDGGRPRKVSMSFLYRSPKQGTLANDKVKVQDIDKLTAVSLGLRGTATEARVLEAEARLEAWLASHAEEHRAAGPIRTLIYNSPFLPAKRQYFEVQIPIEPAKPSE